MTLQILVHISEKKQQAVKSCIEAVLALAVLDCFSFVKFSFAKCVRLIFLPVPEPVGHQSSLIGCRSSCSNFISIFVNSCFVVLWIFSSKRTHLLSHTVQISLMQFNFNRKLKDDDSMNVFLSSSIAWFRSPPAAWLRTPTVFFFFQTVCRGQMLFFIHNQRLFFSLFLFLVVFSLTIRWFK